MEKSGTLFEAQRVANWCEKVGFENQVNLQKKTSRKSGADGMFPFKVEGKSSNVVISSNGDVLFMPDSNIQAR